MLLGSVAESVMRCGSGGSAVCSELDLDGNTTRPEVTSDAGFVSVLCVSVLNVLAVGSVPSVGGWRP